MEIDNKLIKEILETPFWPPELNANDEYFRTHDDCDGELMSGLNVIFSSDGDAWVSTTCNKNESCRFRMPFIGGGRSPRVRNALILLALAIKMDNDEDQIGKK